MARPVGFEPTTFGLEDDITLKTDLVHYHIVYIIYRMNWEYASIYQANYNIFFVLFLS